MSDIDKVEELHHRIRNQIAWREAGHMVLSIIVLVLAVTGVLIWLSFYGVTLPMQLWQEVAAPLLKWSPLAALVLLLALVAVCTQTYVYSHKLDHD